MDKKHLIVAIEPDSIAEELNITPGQKLLTVNGNAVKDVFDYQYSVVDELVTIEIESQNGDIDEYEIEKDYGEDLGLVFQSDLMDDYKSCTNKCIFCFIDQMPPGMRDTLYFKDDDSRLSFLQGNYITMTNMKDEDIDRIIKYHMEPINISIHTTNPELRCKMLNNRFAGKIMTYLTRLHNAGIKMNGQIVLCKGINDGDELQKTIDDLMQFIPNLESLSIVPVGLTKYRQGLYPLDSFTAEDAEKVINIVEKNQQNIYNKLVTHFVHASDEFYILAGREMPEEERYDGYPQLENGVGMYRLLENEFIDALKSLQLNKLVNRNISIATGVLAYPLIKKLANTAKCEIQKVSEDNNISINCYCIKNSFFGEGVTVSGLICGKDIINRLKGTELGSELLLPVNMFRSGEEYFLDDVKKSDVERELGVKVVIVPSDGYSLLNAILGFENTDFRRQIYEQADCGNCWQA